MQDQLETVTVLENQCLNITTIRVLVAPVTPMMGCQDQVWTQCGSL